MYCPVSVYNRGRYRISQKWGRGLSRVWIFHTWTFCSGTYHAVHGQNVGGQNTGGPNASQNCKRGGGGGGGGDKMLSILWDREGKMPNKSHQVCHVQAKKFEYQDVIRKLSKP